MEALIELGRGPVFRLAIALALLGLLRHAVLSAVGFARARARAGDGRIAIPDVLWRTLVWLNPVRYFRGSRRYYSMVSGLFHVGLILVPALYAGHVRLWERGLGVAWPALPGGLADALTLLTIATGIGLLAGRAWARTSRSISGFQDWFLPPLITLEFLSGYLLAHPASNPAPLDVTMLVHVWVGDLLLVLTPFSKIVHCIMLPFSQFVVETAWRLVPGVGRDVVRTLGKEGQPI